MADQHRSNKGNTKTLRAEAPADALDQRGSEPSWRQPLPRRRRPIPQPRNTGDSLRRVGRGVGRVFTNIARIRPNKYWLALLLLGLIGYGAYWVFGGYEFYVYDAEISGNERVTRQEIYAAAGVDQLNILWVRPGQVAQRIETLPGIDRAEVQVRPPNKVRITVYERTPLLAWQAGDEVTWIAEDGETVPLVGAQPPLTLVDAEAAAGDGKGNLRHQVLLDIVALRARRPDLTDLYYGPKEGLYFRAAEGWNVYLGTGGDIATKVALLEAMHEKLISQRTRPVVVDLRIEGQAYLH